MSTTPDTDTFPSLATPMLSEEQHDALFRAELKALGGDNSDSRRLGREFFETPVAKAVEEPVPVVQEQLEDTPAVGDQPETADTSPSEAVTDATDTGTDATSTSNTEAQPTQEEANAWLANLDPKVKEQVDKLLAEKANLEHRVKSDEGRVAAYQRHYDEARRKLEHVTKQPPRTTPAAASTPQKKEVSNESIPAHIKAVMEYDEASGNAMLAEHRASEEREQALRHEIEALKSDVVSPLYQQLEEFRVERELTKLEQERPGALETFKHPIWEEFKRAAPPWLKALAESDNRSEVVTALDEYATWVNHPQVREWATKQYGLVYDAPNAAGATNTTTTATVDPNKQAQAAKVKQEQERKANAQPVNSGAVGRPIATAKPSMEQIMSDKNLLQKWHDEQFELELAKVEGRKPRTTK